jgi:hypothetical protein
MCLSEYTHRLNEGLDSLKRENIGNKSRPLLVDKTPPIPVGLRTLVQST